MGLRYHDPAVWYSMPGVVATYQPQYAPGFSASLHDVSSGIPVGVGTAPAWSSVTGWTFDGSSQYLYARLAPGPTWTTIARVANVWATESASNAVCGALASNDSTHICVLRPRFSSSRHEYNHYGQLATGAGVANGIMAVAGANCYLDGVADGTISQSGSLSVSQIGIGGVWLANYGFGWFCGCDILAMAVYDRPLSQAEIWLASQQMAHLECADWSVWSPRRKWYPYIAAALAGRPGIYGARPTIGLPGGVRIVPQDEGGVNG